MQKIDPAYLFELGAIAKAITELEVDTKTVDGFFILQRAREALKQLFDESVYAHLFRDSTKIQAYQMDNQIENVLAIEDRQEDFPFKVAEILGLRRQYSTLETLFLADLQSGTSYIVRPKGGFDTSKLIESGVNFFHDEVTQKAPDCVDDLQQATRCIAFELPTAAGFHLHRAHEAVLRVYWDCVTGGVERPKEGNMGVYLRELDRLDKGRQSVRSHLRSIKDFHRNPLMHPEQTLESVDQAIDLLSAIRCSIGYMLQEIPGEPPPMFPALDF